MGTTNALSRPTARAAFRAISERPIVPPDPDPSSTAGVNLTHYPPAAPRGEGRTSAAAGRHVRVEGRLDGHLFHAVDEVLDLLVGEVGHVEDQLQVEGVAVVLDGDEGIVVEGVQGAVPGEEG